jgi:glycine dehydrogenase subunit 1
LSSVDGLEFAFPNSPVFREFAVKVPGKSSEALAHIFDLGVIGGFDLGQWWPEKESWILIGCDERTSESDISSLKKSLSSWVEGSS